ncbi:PREDICTED: uncharacterized protein LOC105312992 [Amphimedon queenslandica]|uniref:Uncharacterized protein n=2 Tax=Amphimedon queenslandica TaxID=400682 RepID=A0AAN0IM33_AMPQE|nr:PREDICTED: uncharacterized protein LOC105312992 [Amphimedon queenslandica]|eukprot:XP_011404377.1 PREDICTED: uncharacterized protein LOC105312992 [Amphimedon queenslandica]
MASEARIKKVRSLRRGNRAAVTRNSHKASCKRMLEEKLAALGPLDAKILEAIEDLEASGSTHGGASRNVCGTGCRTPSSSPPPPPKLSRPATHSRLSPTAGGGCSPKIKLPELSMKRFDGDMSQWMSFWDSFSSSVHENSTLSDVEKLNYLSSMLSGTAAEAIAGLSITSSNYGKAVAILNKRFGN